VAAIDAHVVSVDGADTASRHHPKARRLSGGPAPLRVVAVHRLQHPNHWHLVGYGLSQLDGEIPASGAGGEWSGWGFELTFRVVSEEEPAWAVDLLVNLAGYVEAGGHPFAQGHLLDLRGPVLVGSESAITAAMFVEDPALGTLEGPYGWIEFLQVVGLTADELELCRQWNAEGVKDLLAREDPLLVTRLDRPSLADDPAIALEIEAARVGEGSSLHELRIATLKLTRRFRRGTVVEMGSGASTALGPALGRELVGAGASFPVVGDTCTVRFSVADTAGWERDTTGIEVLVPLEQVGEVAQLFDGAPGWRSSELWPGLWFRVTG
jgi:hypothetical protein